MQLDKKELFRNLPFIVTFNLSFYCRKNIRIAIFIDIRILYIRITTHIFLYFILSKYKAVVPNYPQTKSCPSTSFTAYGWELIIVESLMILFLNSSKLDKNIQLSIVIIDIYECLLPSLKLCCALKQQTSLF